MKGMKAMKIMKSMKVMKSMKKNMTVTLPHPQVVAVVNQVVNQPHNGSPAAVGGGSESPKLNKGNLKKQSSVMMASRWTDGIKSFIATLM